MEEKNKSSGMNEEFIEHKEGKIKGNKGRIIYDNIEFDSKLEVTIYKHLVKRQIQFKYNAKAFELQKAFKPTIPFFIRMKDRKTHMNVFKLNMSKIQNMSYTPDFILDYKGYTIILEAKGFPNERYPMVKKLFRKLLERKKNKENLIFAEVKTIKEINKLLEIIDDESFKRNQLASR